LLLRKDVILMAVYVSVQSNYMPPYQWYLHNTMAVYVSVQSNYMPPCQWYLYNTASYPYYLQRCTSIPGQMFAFAPVAGESLVGPFSLWD